MKTELFLYGVLMSGAFAFGYDSIEGIIRTARCKFVIRRNLKRDGKTESEEYDGALYHIDRLLKASGWSRFFQDPKTFIAVCILIFLGVFSAAAMASDFSTAMTFGVFSAVFPYILCYAVLQQKRSLRSKEGDVLVHELYNNYKICSYNMGEAIAVTAVTLENAPLSRSLMTDLAKQLQLSAAEEDFSRCLDAFRYAVGTTWGNVLSANIYFAMYRGIKVDEGLGDLSRAMTKSREVDEYKKRENGEASMMLKYLVPVCYLFTVIGACRFFDFTLDEFFRSQFFTPAGFRLFAIIAMIYSAGLLAEKFFKGEKMDI